MQACWDKKKYMEIEKTSNYNVFMVERGYGQLT